jgi:hypothetical protein
MTRPERVAPPRPNRDALDASEHRLTRADVVRLPEPQEPEAELPVGPLPELKALIAAG